MSGDYYDFLTMDSDKLILAVGDVSGKGISAALLMATIHSAVRAYSLEGMPSLRLPVAVGETPSSGPSLISGSPGAEHSSGTLLSLLNHQLYQSTPAEKYATLFLGIYDGQRTQADLQQRRPPAADHSGRRWIRAPAGARRHGHRFVRPPQL